MTAPGGPFSPATTPLLLQRRVGPTTTEKIHPANCSSPCSRCGFGHDADDDDDDDDDADAAAAADADADAADDDDEDDDDEEEEEDYDHDKDEEGEGGDIMTMTMAMMMVTVAKCPARLETLRFTRYRKLQTSNRNLTP